MPCDLSERGFARGRYSLAGNRLSSALFERSFGRPSVRPRSGPFWPKKPAKPAPLTRFGGHSDRSRVAPFVVRSPWALVRRLASGLRHSLREPQAEARGKRLPTPRREGARKCRIQRLASSYCRGNAVFLGSVSTNPKKVEPERGNVLPGEHKRGCNNSGVSFVLTPPFSPQSIHNASRP